MMRHTAFLSCVLLALAGCGKSGIPEEEDTSSPFTDNTALLEAHRSGNSEKSRRYYRRMVERFGSTYLSRQALDTLRQGNR